MEVELPWWALFLVATLAVCVVGAYLYGRVAPLVLDGRLVKLDSVKQFAEYHEHVVESPGAIERIFDDAARGGLDVKFYDSDGCMELTGETR